MELVKSQLVIFAIHCVFSRWLQQNCPVLLRCTDSVSITNCRTKAYCKEMDRT